MECMAARMHVVEIMNLNETWASIYWTFQDNAFDYVGKPFYNDNDNTVKIWNGNRMVEYVEVPF
jgi:hypothetical protein